MKLLMINANSTNPYRNLALEEFLFNLVDDETIILYFWQNDNTVMIGRNQNPYTECNLEAVRQENVLIARRFTGGGAVFHDLGNLNFSIIVPILLYDIKRSTFAISDALKRLGLNAYPNGRNDICIGNKKISGNAYYSNQLVGLHHGTILYEADFEKINRILSVPKYKLEKRGIASVKSRIGDIVSERPDISLRSIKESFINSLVEEYNIDTVQFTHISDERFLIIVEKYRSDEWIFGKYIQYEITIKREFNWGIIDVLMTFKNGMVSDIDIATDALDIEKVEALKKKIKDKICLGYGYNLNKILNVFDNI